MDDLAIQRQAVKDAYDNNPTWVSKVDQMSNGQLIAVYFRFIKQNKI